MICITLAALFFTPVAVDRPRPTAAEVIQRIQLSILQQPPADTVDTFKAGDPRTIVTGIVTTFTPTMNVLRRAVALHANLIVTHEPTFYNHLDQRTLFTNDPVYQEKLAYIRDHHLVVWRFHDQWHLRVPDGIGDGFIAAAGWQQYQHPGDPFFFTLPPTTVDALALDLQHKLNARIVRIIGDPNLRVTGVAYSPGASGEVDHIQSLERSEVQVLVAGEAHEWEAVEYVHDAQQQGRPKALILLGHNTSEEDGMETCAIWLRHLFPSLPVEHVRSGEPYWLPGHPPQ